MRPMRALAVTTVDLARVQFAMTSLYHFLFVPLTLGLAPLVAVMQTLWYRSGDEAWLRLTRFFGTLMLINFAIGVATGLVQEFQFGMNWSVYSEFVGDVFGAPLAIEGLAAFMLESTFLGLWIFGWDRLSQRVHLATVWLFALGTLALGVLHHRRQLVDAAPRRLDVVDGRAELTSIWELLTNRFAIWAYMHVMLVGLTTAAVVVFGVACWHLLRGRNQELFRQRREARADRRRPDLGGEPLVGSHLGVVITDYQPMKIAATEALWDTEQPAAFSLFQIGGFTEDDQTPSFDIEIPKLLSFLATGSFNGEVQGMNQLQAQYEARVRAGQLHPARRDDVLEHAGHGLPRHARLPRRSRSARSSPGAGRSRRRAGSSGPASSRSRSRTSSALAGWVLTEVGRQPWIVWGLLKTADANSPSVSSGDDRAQPRRVRAPLRRARRRRLRPDAPLRAPRPARGRRRGRRVRASRRWRTDGSRDSSGSS